MKPHDLRHKQRTETKTNTRCSGRLFTTLALVALTCGFSAAAAAVDGHTQITAAVHDFIASHYPDYDQSAENTGGNAAANSGRRVEIAVTRLDARLIIPVCAVPLQVRLNQNQPPLGRLSVLVDCQDTSPWSRYIPATVKLFQPILVSARPLARGNIVTEADLQVREIDVATVRGSWLENTQLALGKEVLRTLPAGMPITAEALTEQELIARGETIVLTAQKGAVVIRQQGVALQAGESGSQISVRNSNSDRVVQAIVTGPGEAQVTF